jgi:hypothetical protein
VFIQDDFLFFSGKQGKLTVHELKEFFKQVQKVKHIYDSFWHDELMKRSKCIDNSTLCGLLPLMREITESCNRLDRKIYQLRSVNFSSLKRVEQKLTISNRCRLICHDLIR